MKWLALLLLLANLVLAAYGYLQHTRPHPDANIPDFQMNADKVRIVAEPPPAPIVEKRTACLEWGSFGDLELRRVREALSPLDLQDRLSARDDEVTTYWWVYLPPQPSRERMETKASELEELGVPEYATITEPGQWRYAISLGAFREESAARAYLSQLRSKGVRSGDIVRREQELVQTTLVIRAPDPGESTKLVELATRFPGTRMQATECVR